MKKKEIEDFLENTKVYVNGKSKQIQEKLFSLGYTWANRKKDVKYTDKPFLFVCENSEIAYTDDMEWFMNDESREITAEQILSLELTESFRPFKNKDECWNEMQNHQPFGWLHHKCNDYYEPIRVNISKNLEFSSLFNAYNFADGTPFGIKE